MRSTWLAIAFAAFVTTAVPNAPAGAPRRRGGLELGEVRFAHQYMKRKRGVECVFVPLDDSAAAARRPPTHAIYDGRTEGTGTGLTIILMGTDQLEQTPDAKAGFVRAAQAWERLIADPITVVIQVDYGETDFGTPFKENILGQTQSAIRIVRAGYSTVRGALEASASNDEDRALYAALPEGAVPTTHGPATNVIATAANFQALGLLPPVLDTGDPGPSIAFNAAFSFDFDESNGVDLDKTEFFGVAAHEIGHALGFVSVVGEKSSNPDYPTIAVLDIFRVGRTATLANFDTTKRRLDPKGEQFFFDGSEKIPLSTGNAKGKKGDGNQASHWKADDITGVYIGVMDPTIAPGFRVDITDDDLRAFDRLGYTLADTTP